MKYSPGFDDPSARPRLARARSLVVAAVLLGAGALGATLLAYLSPSMRAGLDNILLVCAQALGLK